MDLNIRFIEKEKMDLIVPLLAQLNPKITHNLLRNRLQDMVLQGYQCVGVLDDDKLIGISGMWVLVKYYVGKHIEPDNVFLLPEYQGKGIGKLLMNWIFDYANSIGCVASELNCDTDNESGTHFWKVQGYEVVGYHFQKQLNR
ncbi:Acetyltransferase (GNAT) family protein [Pricia antarctica]|uniref:Acetyltransferase (GNAT) family protein n=1 Tax=Pricia antarctica TaxID=641691 RepID=A0A1G7BP06_9FLAO|nr:GNAT family N-acetyltransferase [Pricia antarctica]SDE28662.1 Acetyltransferase (GNAT) family protein [Pricia antarctica]